MLTMVMRSRPHARPADILDRLHSGTMPWGGTWPEEKVDVFKRSIESGFEP
jgi:hypothetical protein